jgi:hypothetical protein
VEIIPPRRASRDRVALELSMAALAPGAAAPIALEIAGSERARSFIARATEPGALRQLASQLRARYPHCEILPLSAERDPLQLRPGEAASALELTSGAPAYAPLRVLETPWRLGQMAREGADPLLGVVAAFDNLPPRTRAIAQLALAPAADTWSEPFWRMSVEHPLDPERAALRAEQIGQMSQARVGGGSGGLGAVLALLIVTLGLFLLQRNWSSAPAWLREDLLALVHGQGIALTKEQVAWLAPWLGSVCLSALVLAAFALALQRLLCRHSAPVLYDQRLVQEKAGSVAYHARVRILVVSEVVRNAMATNATSALPTDAERGRLVPLSPLWQSLLKLINGIELPDRRASEDPPTGAQVMGDGRSIAARIARGLGIALQTSVAAGARRWRAWWRRRAERQMSARGRREALRGFIAAYRQYHLGNGAYFVPVQLSRNAATWLLTPHPPLLRRLCHVWRAPGWRWGVCRSMHLLTIAEIATLWRLPQGEDLPYLPFVAQTRARTLLAPTDLTRARAEPSPPPATVSFSPFATYVAPPTSASLSNRIGNSRHAGHVVPVQLPPDATRRNTLAVAKTGKGKSTLLLALARAALGDNCGLVLIDPHGDLAEAALIEAARAGRDDALLVDLGDRDFPIGLNPLDVTLFPDRDKATSNVIAVLAQIWKEYWGPRMESALEAALKSLFEANAALVARDPLDGPDAQYTLLDVTPLLTFIAFRRQVLADVRDPALLAYWLRFEALQQRLQQDIITPVTTKLEKFANAAVARRIVGQGRSTLNMAEAVRRGQVVLVKTARGVVGQDTAALVGALILGLLQVTVGEQAGLAITARRPVRVFVDEFQTLPGVDFGAMLSELRKFGASFALATQALAHLDALDKALRPTVMANVDQLYAFSMSAEDARLIERELDGVVDALDLIALDDFTCYARLTVHGQRAPVFSLRLDAPDRVDRGARDRAGDTGDTGDTGVDLELDHAEGLRRRSQSRIGRPVADVDAQGELAAARRSPFVRLQQAQSGRLVASRAGEEQDVARHGEHGERRGARWTPRRSSRGNEPNMPNVPNEPMAGSDTPDHQEGGQSMEVRQRRAARSRRAGRMSRDNQRDEQSAEKALSTPESASAPLGTGRAGRRSHWRRSGEPAEPGARRSGGAGFVLRSPLLVEAPTTEAPAAELEEPETPDAPTARQVAVADETWPGEEEPLAPPTAPDDSGFSAASSLSGGKTEP